MAEFKGEYEDFFAALIGVVLRLAPPEDIVPRSRRASALLDANALQWSIPGLNKLPYGIALVVVGIRISGRG